jgi:hypothetical protein
MPDFFGMVFFGMDFLPDAGLDFLLPYMVLCFGWSDKGMLSFHFFLGFFAVFADCLKSFDVGAPFEPGFRMDSPEPSLMRFLLACMFAYSPFFAISPFGFMGPVPSGELVGRCVLSVVSVVVGLPPRLVLF